MSFYPLWHGLAIIGWRVQDSEDLGIGYHFLSDLLPILVGSAWLILLRWGIKGGGSPGIGPTFLFHLQLVSVYSGWYVVYLKESHLSGSAGPFGVPQ